MAAVNLELRKFDITEIKDDKVVVLIGKRNTGKSPFYVKIYYFIIKIFQLDRLSRVQKVLINFTVRLSPNYLFMMNKSEIVQNVLKRQKTMIEKINKGEFRY